MSLVDIHAQERRAVRRQTVDLDIDLVEQVEIEFLVDRARRDGQTNRLTPIERAYAALHDAVDRHVVHQRRLEPADGRGAHPRRRGDPAWP